MRGLPSCGKSHMARRLAGDDGVICETDEFFYTEVGDDPSQFNYDAACMDEAPDWNFERFCQAVESDVPRVIVGRGNSRSRESCIYIEFAMAHGHRVELKEPDSEWWQEIRVLLKYRDLTGPALDEWADRLAEMNRTTHRTPAKTIRRWMSKWKHDLTIEDMLKLAERRRAAEETRQQRIKIAPQPDVLERSCLTVRTRREPDRQHGSPCSARSLWRCFH